ncbi:MAG TPA: squalene synthase HpnC [Casimicrobiaceae bacterium]|nr:squalene synthase HpnC [Casimicrobiaceae bacterium]
MSVGHYENFPVASLLVPARYRGAVVAIYRFARAADDIADEGNDDKATRHRGLDQFSRRLDAIERGETPEPPFADLARAVREHALPIDLLRDLLSAFSQDVDVIRYATFADVLAYCRRSANPIGRLLLAMYRVDDAQALSESDAICTALQLANFWQDIAIDWRKNTRLYLPIEDIERFGVSFAQIAEGRCDASFSRLMAFETARTRAMFDRGRPLVRRLPWRLGLELAAVIAGGTRVLERIDAVRGDVFAHRPVLGKRDWALLACRMLAPTAGARAA